jgi:hypothetical protein
MKKKISVLILSAALFVGFNMNGSVAQVHPCGDTWDDGHGCSITDCGGCMYVSCEGGGYIVCDQ